MFVSVDRKDALSQGDVAILKKQGVGLRGRLLTFCSRCGKSFPTTLRRMVKGEAVVRNVPQCVSCRGSYRSLGRPKPGEAPRSPGELRIGDLVKVRPGREGSGVHEGCKYRVASVRLQAGGWLDLEHQSSNLATVHKVKGPRWAQNDTVCFVWRLERVNP